jgi:phosphatidylethanolamine/phosphatidyl-N-methylethanolamine N-methyltransferase
VTEHPIAPRSLADHLLFLRTWSRSPLRVAAQVPSGARLAAAMAATVNPSRPGQVLEFGAGTGAFTAALLRAGVEERRLILVEAEPAFAQVLRTRFPRARILGTDARKVPALLAREGVTLAGTISGLPILQWPAAERLRLVIGCLRLSAGGCFAQFTYMPGSPVPLGRAALRARVGRTVWRNLWPARVWSYRLPPPPAPAA